MRGRTRLLAGAALLAALVAGTACSSTGSNELVCDSTEVAPGSQPGATGPDEALEWFLENADSDLPTTGFTESGSSDTRRVYSDGMNQISISALPADDDEDPLWVVTMTYECR